MPRNTLWLASPRSRRTRLIAAAAATVAASMVLGACAAGSATAPNATGAPSGTITYWFAPYDGSQEATEAFLNYDIRPFEEKYPDVKVDAVPKALSLINQNTETALAAGEGPDIVGSGGIAFAYPYAEAGFLRDLTDVYEEKGWGDRLLPWAAESGFFEDKFLLVPQAYETLVLFYNKSLFEENGWKPPTNRQELEDIALQAQAKDILPFAAGNADYPAGTEWLVTSFMNQVAGPDRIYQALKGELPWTDPAFADAMGLMKEYFDKGWFGGGLNQYFSTVDTKKLAQFANGEAAMFISGTWEFISLPTYFDEAGNEFDWVGLPSLAEGIPAVYPLSIGGTLSVNANSKNPNAAEHYLDWYISDTENMWAGVAANGTPPLPVKFEASDIPSGIDPRFARVYTNMLAASDAGEVGYTTWTSWGAKAEQYILDNTDKVLFGDVSIDDFLTQMNAAFQDDLSRGLVPVPYSTGR